ncbi:hypothetical protein PZ938_00600 [Luteipulveratus sp. YIM 133132]|uniref:hypothetical protein n=1 Tax=Luteipulveratus flavus TaxID=3031728 RepID=UPI0023AEBED8|nr:hypothetical protein [Luteipulveratus sp. YIM 133132]MDE9364093.1 hypothetical protein [Luteipulveratus sp. YIM 133132]
MAHRSRSTAEEFDPQLTPTTPLARVVLREGQAPTVAGVAVPVPDGSTAYDAALAAVARQAARVPAGAIRVRVTTASGAAASGGRDLVVRADGSRWDLNESSPDRQAAISNRAATAVGAAVCVVLALIAVAAFGWGGVAPTELAPPAGPTASVAPTSPQPTSAALASSVPAMPAPSSGTPTATVPAPTLPQVSAALPLRKSGRSSTTGNPTPSRPARKSATTTSLAPRPSAASTPTPTPPRIVPTHRHTIPGYSPPPPTFG